jgi:hypothetical protein
MKLSRFTALSAFLCGALILAFYSFSIAAETRVPAVIYLVIPAFAILAVLLFRSVANAARKSPQRFVTAFMASVTLKLLLTASFLGIYLFFNKDQKVIVALSTFVIYISYTVLLIQSLKRTATGSNPSA